MNQTALDFSRSIGESAATACAPGTAYGRLTVARFHDQHPKGARWLCRCVCGAEKVVAAHNLRSGATTSCGCLQRDRRRSLPLKQTFVYDSATGVFRWAVDRISAKRGEIAGTVDHCGYIRLTLSGRQQYAHRLAWEYAHGPLKSGLEVDHINGDKHDNRLCNLRAVAPHINNQNIRKPRAGNRTGVLGVTLHKCGRFMAQLKRPGRTTGYLGLFDTAQEAHEAYLAEKRKHHEGCTL